MLEGVGCPKFLLKAGSPKVYEFACRTWAFRGVGRRAQRGEEAREDREERRGFGLGGGGLRSMFWGAMVEIV